MPAMVWNKKDWIKAGSDEYAQYMLAARERFLKHQAATVNKLKQVYIQTAQDIADEIRNLTPGTLRYNHLAHLQKILEERAKTITALTRDAIYNGIRLAVKEGTSGAQQIMQDLFDYDKTGVKWMFADINERAIMAMLARTYKDGLKLSDRIWRTGEHVKNNLSMIVEDAVARGMDSRKLAKQIQQYMQPDRFTAMKMETRRNLGVSSDISYEAMRLARTEMNNAFHEGTILGNQAAPSYLGIIWMLSGSHPLPDVCDDYASHNGNGFWPKGSEPPKPHPQCFCVALPKHEDPEAFRERLRRWAENPNIEPELERWYNNTGLKYIGRPGLQQIKTVKDQEPYWVKEAKKTAADAPLNDRVKLAEYLRDKNGSSYPIRIQITKVRGFCEYDFNQRPIKVQQVVLQANDPRPYHYQIKTAFHESVHAMIDNIQLTTQDQLYINTSQWFVLEDTIAETVAHFLAREAGITAEIAPSYSEHMIDILPRLKKLPEYTKCKTIADFGRVMAKYRFDVNKQTGWDELYKAISSQRHDKIQYAKQYEQYVRSNIDSIIDAIMENQGSNDAKLRAIVEASVQRGWNYYDTNEQGFVDSLAIAMNRLGVK